MGLVSHGAPRDLILALRNQFALKVFVETGTFRGETAEWASLEFEKVYSVEANLQIYDSTRAKLGGIPNLTLAHGESPTFLHALLGELVAPMVVWLDAHWCASAETFGQENECPLLAELDALSESKCENFVLIDDARLFLAPPPAPHDYTKWPSLEEVMQSTFVARRRPHFVVVDDVILMAPLHARSWIADYLRAAETRRGEQMLSSGANMAAAGIKRIYWGARRKARDLFRRALSRPLRR